MAVRSEQPTGTSAVHADAGVLVVHGIGAQRKNETLLEWAEPIVRRIAYLVAAPPASVSSGTEQKVLFTEVDLGTQGQSQVLISHPRPPDAAGPARSSLLFREAVWSEAFLPLGRGEVFAWSARFAHKALFNATHHFARMMASRIGVFGWPLAGLTYLVAVILWVSILLLLPLLSVLLFVPGAQAVANRLVTTLTEFIGDPAVLLSRPVRAAAVRQIVRDRYEQLLADLAPGAPVTVIAHSQGAAIAAEVLFGDPSAQSFATQFPDAPTPKPTLITVGSGVNLLADGYTDRERGPLNNKPIASWIENHSVPTWIDIWATWDAVPAGPVGDTDSERAQRLAETVSGAGVSALPGPRERMVRNTANPFTDHQRYTHNIIEVIDPIARICIGMPIDDPRAAERAEQAARRERWVRLVRVSGIVRLAVLLVSAAWVWLPGPAAVLPVELIEPALSDWPWPWTWFGQALMNLLTFGVLSSIGLWLSGRLRAAHLRRLEWDISDAVTRFLSRTAVAQAFLVALGAIGSIRLGLAFSDDTGYVAAFVAAAAYLVSVTTATSVGQLVDLGTGHLPDSPTGHQQA